MSAGDQWYGGMMGIPRDWATMNKSAAESAQEMAKRYEAIKLAAKAVQWQPAMPPPDPRQRPIREWDPKSIVVALEVIALLQAAKKGGQRVYGTHLFDLPDLRMEIEVSADKLADSTIHDIPSLVEFFQTEYAIQKITG